MTRAPYHSQNRQRRDRHRQDYGLGAAMAGGNPSYGRVEQDFYPTPPDVTDALLDYYNPYLEAVAQSLHDPCGGDGAMLDRFEAYGWKGRATASDISPRRADVETRDVFDSFEYFPTSYAIITNPPFNLAVPIIKHVLTQNHPPAFFALVLKATFWHAARRYKLFLEHTPAAIHPLLWRPDFHGLGNPTMDIMWCVWTKAALARDEPYYIPLVRPEPRPEPRSRIQAAP